MEHSDMFARLTKFSPTDIIQKTKSVNESGSQYTVADFAWTVADARREYEYRGGLWVSASATAIEHFLTTGTALEITQTY